MKAWIKITELSDERKGILLPFKRDSIGLILGDEICSK
jgi:hypothetical protein